VKSCPNNCSGNGVCNTDKGICTCNPGWNQPDCSKQQNEGASCQCYITNNLHPSRPIVGLTISKGDLYNNISCADAVSKKFKARPSDNVKCVYGITDIGSKYACDHVFNY
jgi:hypothetical protein